MIRFILIFIGFNFVISNNSIAQCNISKHIYKCTQISRSEGLLTKEFKFDTKSRTKTEFVYNVVISKNNKYILNMSSDGYIHVVVKNTSGKTIASNFYKDKYFNKITISNQKTGLYTFNFELIGDDNLCGGAILKNVK